MRRPRLCLYCSERRMGHGFLICAGHWKEIFGPGGTYPEKPPVVNHEIGPEATKLEASVADVVSRARRL